MHRPSQPFSSFKARWRRFCRHEGGAYAIMTAVALPAVVGSFGLMSEVASWYATRQYEQQAADNAALSAAIELSAGGTQVATIARAVTASNGFVDKADGVTVEVNWPPLSGERRGEPSAVEVIIRKVQPGMFSTILNVKSTTVAARSVAMAPATDGCVVSLNKTVWGAIRMQGSVSVDAAKCGFYSNSSSSGSMDIGGSSSLLVDSLTTVGTISTNGNIGITGTTRTNWTPYPDPYGSLAMPTTTSPIKTIGQNDTSATPGTFSAMNIKREVVLSPGVYVVDGDLTMSNGGSLTGTGVTLYFTRNGSLKMTGGSFAITAPKTGPYRGMAVMAARNMPAYSTFDFTGGAGITLGGAIYMPTSSVRFRGGASSEGCAQVVADTIDFGGNSALKMNCAAFGLKSPSTALVLVE